MLDYADIISRLQIKPVWVRLYDGLRICLVAVLDNETFKAKFIPCASNASEYIIKHKEIKEFVDLENC